MFRLDSIRVRACASNARTPQSIASHRTHTSIRREKRKKKKGKEKGRKTERKKIQYINIIGPNAILK